VIRSKAPIELRKFGGPYYVAAIGTDGTRAVVWGLGVSDDRESHAISLAVMDAELFDESWDSNGSFTTVITREQWQRVRNGEVDCEALGIAVSMRNGRLGAP
jgi:hypothetical protein